MSVRRRLTWMLRGQHQTDSALASLGDDVRALQQRVDGLQAALDDVRSAQRAVADRQLDEFDRIRAAMSTATDDLTARVEALRHADGGS